MDKESRHVRPHLHHALEFVYVTEGTLELGVGKELYHMEKGDLGVVFPDMIHHYQVFPGKILAVICLPNQRYAVSLEQNCFIIVQSFQLSLESNYQTRL